MPDIESPFAKAATPAIRDFLVAAHAYAANAKPPLKPKSLSSILFGSGAQLTRLEDGCDLTTGRLSDAWKRLRDLEAGGPRTRKPRNPKGASDGEHVEEARRG